MVDGNSPIERCAFFCAITAGLKRVDSIHQLPPGSVDWEEAAQLAIRLRRTGKTIRRLDILIATSAIRSGSMLLHTGQHYRTIAEGVPPLQESLRPWPGRE